ncbi:hypothetical protein JCM3765_001237 [Sporobolomyces pararoseus]
MGVFQPSDVKRRICCSCIPARVGTLALSTLSILVSVTIALQATVALFQDNFANGFLVWIGLLQCVLWWSLVNVCVYGWLGTVKQRFEWVHWYYELLWWHLWINVAVGMYGIILFSLPYAKEYRAAICTALALVEASAEAAPEDVLTSQESALLAAQCVNLVKKHLLIIDFAYVIGILIQLWLSLMVAHYLDELADIDAAVRFGVDIESPTPPYDLDEIKGSESRSTRKA